MKHHLAQAAAIVVATVGLTGCSTNSPTTAPSASDTPVVASSPTATKLDVKQGDSALVIASAVDGCRNVQAVKVAADANGIASAAHCTLLRQSVTFYSYRQAGGSRQMKDDFMTGASGAEAYYADGSFWAARVDWVPGSKPDVAGQKAAMEAIEASIPSALVMHVH